MVRKIRVQPDSYYITDLNDWQLVHEAEGGEFWKTRGGYGPTMKEWGVEFHYKGADVFLEGPHSAFSGRVNLAEYGYSHIGVPACIQEWEDEYNRKVREQAEVVRVRRSQEATAAKTGGAEKLVDEIDWLANSICVKIGKLESDEEVCEEMDKLEAAVWALKNGWEE
jgi:hypothetical protein